MSDPGYYFLPGDYARDTAHLTNDEDLAYRRLLDAYYSRGGPFPAAVGWLQRVSRVSLDAVQAVADEFFPINGDGLRHNKRADEEIKKRIDFRLAQSERGKLSWEARKGRGQTVAIPSAQTPVRDSANGGSFPVQTGDEPPYPLPYPLPIPKPSPTKKPLSNVKPSDAAVELASFMYENLKSRFPEMRTPNLAVWSKDCDKMIRLDNRDPSDARAVIEWTAGDFWGTVTLSPNKLRENWDKIQAKRGNGKAVCTTSQRDKYKHLEEQDGQDE